MTKFQDGRRNSFDGLLTNPENTPTSALKKARTDQSPDFKIAPPRFRRSEGGLGNRPQPAQRDIGFKDFIEIMAQEEATGPDGDDAAKLKEYARRHIAKLVAV
jgi:hypothetical protein